MADPVVHDWFYSTGAALVREADRLWPEEGEGDPAYRASALVEEVGEVVRAITKRRHAWNASDGLCKGKTVEQWNEELRMELAQALGVIFDMAHREGIDLVTRIEFTVAALQERKPGT